MEHTRVLRLFASVIAAFLLVILLHLSAQAQATCTFQGPGNSWQDAENWDCGVVPGADDNANLGSFYVTNSAPVVVANLEMSSAEVTLDAPLTVSGDMAVGGGAFYGNATLTVDTGGTLHLPDYVTFRLTAVEVKVLGALDVGTTQSAWATINLHEAATLLTAGDVTVTATLYVYGDGVAPAERVTNTGAWLFATDTYASEVHVPFANAGTLHVQQGDALLAVDDQHPGAFIVDTGAQLQLSGVHELLSGASVTGDGALTVRGTLRIPAETTDLTLQRIHLSGGTLDVRAPATIANLLSVDYGTITGEATLTIGAGGLLRLADYYTLNVHAITLNVLGAMQVGSSQGAWYYLYLSDGATLRTAGTVTVTATLYLYADGSEPVESVINTGEWVFATALYASELYVRFNNAGAIRVEVGEVNLAQGGEHSGEFSTDPDATLRLAGIHELIAGASVTGAQAITVQGTLRVTLAATNLTLQRLYLAGGTLDALAPVTIANLLSVDSGTITGTETVTVASDATLRLNDYGTFFVQAVALHVLGALEVGTPGGWYYFYLYEGATLRTAGAVTVSAALYLYTDGGEPVGAVINTGTWRFVGMDYPSEVYVRFDNNGVLRVEAGVVNLMQGGEHTGEFAVDAGTTLRLGGVHELLSGASVTGDQSLTVEGTLRVAAGAEDLTLQRLTLSSGLLDARAPVTVTHALTVNYSGGIGGTAGMIVTLDVDGVATFLGGYVEKVELRNLGEFDLSDGGYFYVYENAVLRNVGTLLLDNYAAIQTGDATNPQFINTGHVQVMGAGNVTLDLEIHNSGWVTATDSLLYVGKLTQTAGALTLDNANMNIPVPFLLEGGLLRGNGSLFGSLINSGGIVRPGAHLDASPGTLTIGGNYTQGSGGALAIELGGTEDTDYDRLIVNAFATLDGALDVTLLGGYAPAAPISFSIIQYLSHTGQFATVTLPTTGALLTPVYFAQSLELQTTTALHTLTVNVVGNGTVNGAGINCGADCTESYGEGTQVTLSATPAFGHSFSGWSGACTGTGACVVTMDAAKSVTATFAVVPPTQHTLTVNVVGNGSVTGTGINCGADCTENYNAGTQVTLSATPASGHSFSGWSGACTGMGACIVTMDAAKSVTATFAPIPPVQHTLTVNVAGNGTVTGTGINCGADCTESYNAGTQVTLSATPASGHSFSGWSGACTGTGACVVTMDAAKSVTATFAPIPPVQHTLTVNVVGNGTVTGTGINCGADCTEPYNAGTQVTLSATPASGHSFSGWSGACTGTGTCIVTMDAAKSVTASFTEIPPVQHTLTVNVAGNGTVTGTGINCGADCTEPYNAGTQITLSATPASGHSFSGWSGACTGTGTCVVTMDAAKSVTATFTEIPPTQQPLVITSVAPASGFAGQPQLFTITGSGFSATTTGRLVRGATVVPLQLTYVSPTSLAAVTPANIAVGVYALNLQDGARSAALANAYQVLTATAEELYSSVEFLVTDPQQLRTGDSATIRLRVFRNGAPNSPPLTNVRVRFHLNSPTGPALGTVQIASLKRNNSALTIPLPWTAPAAGTYTIYAVIDPENLVDESNEANNVVSRTVAVLARPADLAAPVIDRLRVTPRTTRDATVRVRTTARDPAPGSGVTQMYIADYVYSPSARKFVAHANTGWIPFKDDLQFKLWQQTPVHFVVVWVADGAGNVSTPRIDRVTLLSRKSLLHGGRDFFYWLFNDPNANSATAAEGDAAMTVGGEGDQITVTLTPISGDPDLYVWTTAGSYHSLNETGIDQVTIPRPADGIVLVEVHGYSESEYDIAIDEVTGAAESTAISAADAAAPTAKTPLSEPIVPLDLEVPDSLAPETMPQGAAVEYKILLPIINGQ